ncbi:hypothetical protein Caci_7312 [Catenulispora acidiphila DSM 44928]|uniref:Uncharacterized protein n=1 Tax=Catenulispora acidiphila (strain DSM 44928 / JCM 14897 / NBRC 102108 / NRRL B-24433 / ID139908) TaxID=479433 RepID=C7Q8F3_CATAD|nr:hypothetical protein [Catenulispora acidiphila]ACU76141.1 hypothetical protein Caci_7312 [Catenulispora acidiphila DSM 44928]
MSWLTDGSDVATMATGLSAVTAAFVWTNAQLRGWKQERAAMRRRNWHGYIELGMIDTWGVRLVEQPDEPTARVVLEVVTSDGTPDDHMAHTMHQRVKQDGWLSRSPTPTEYEFLKHLYRERGYGKGERVD